MSRKHAIHNLSSGKFWTECGLWYQFKKRDLDAGTFESPDTDASVRGTFLHDICEDAAKLFLRKEAQDCVEAVHLVYASRLRDGVELPNRWDEREDLEQAAIALSGVMDLIFGMGLPYRIFEPALQLSHEPDSEGYTDVVAFSVEDLLVNDYKFGVTPVEPDDVQNVGYAANVRDFILRHPKLSTLVPADWRPNVTLAIAQPAIRGELSVVGPIPWSEIERRQRWMEVVAERQREGKDKSGASSLSTCEWCQWKAECAHRVQLTSHIMTQAFALQPAIPDYLVEEIARSAAPIADVVKDCKARVIADEVTFPNWRRATVYNGDRWPENVDVSDVAHQLRLAGCENPYALATPASIRDSNKDRPNVLAKLKELVVDGGSHVRLRYTGRPTTGTIEERPRVKPAAAATKVEAPPKAEPKKRSRKKAEPKSGEATTKSAKSTKSTKRTKKA